MIGIIVQLGIIRSFHHINRNDTILLRRTIIPIDDLTALGQKMRKARKNKELTQQELSDLSHVSVKQIANIEKGKMNPSYLILRALAKVLHISLDTLINPDISLEDEGVNQMKMFYSSCPPKMRDTMLHHTQETVKELTELSEKFEMKRGKQAPLNTEFRSVAARSPFHSGRH